MTQETGAAASTMDAFVRKQAVGDALVNVVLTAAINGWLTRGLPYVPGSLPFGDTAPSLGGTFVGIAVLQSLLLTPIVFAITVVQRRKASVVPSLAPDVRYAGASTRLTLLHFVVTLIGALALGALVKAVAPDLRLSRWGFVALATLTAGALAWVLSISTTRRTLRLG